MIPILYEATETQFDHGGLGTLSDAISVIPDEERNGKFELTVKYPLFGKLFGELKNDRIIKADASHRLKNQLFKIIRITKPMKGIVTIHAEHVSYLSQDLALAPSVSYSGNAQQALQQWANGIVDDHPFTVWSNISHSTNGTWTIDKVENPRRALGGVAGSILDSYGGEYLFDNYDIRLYQARGVDNGIRIAYGKNLIDLEQEEEIASTYTSVYPFVVDEDDNVLTLPEIYIDSENVDKYARRKILPLDLSLEEIKTVEQLRNRTKQYIEQNEIGIPKVNLKVKFIDLANTLEYKDLIDIEDIGLCDWVIIDFEELGIKRTAKVIRSKWNTLMRRYEELEIGEARASLTKTINAPMENRIENINQIVEVVRRQANGKNRTYDQSTEPTGGNYQRGDQWIRPIQDGHHEMYVWDGSQWSYVLSTADTDANKRAIEENTRLVDEAKEAADQALIAGQDALKAGQDAQQVADDALVAGNEAKTLGEQAQVAADNALTAASQVRSLAEQAKADASEATTRADAANQQINNAIQNAGFSTLAELTSDIQSISNRADANALTAIDNASAAMSNALTALNNTSGLESTVQNINVDINQINGTLDLKADRQTVDALSGIVENHTFDIQANAEGLALKADSSVVDTLTGNVNTLSTQVGLIDGELSSKISQTQLQSAIDGIEVGGRNLLRNSVELTTAGGSGTGITTRINDEGHLEITAQPGNQNYVSNMGLSASSSLLASNLKEGDLFTFSVEIKSENSTSIPTIYFKPGMGYFSMKGTMSHDFSRVYYTGTWKEASNWSPHMGFQNAIGTFVLRKAKLEKGNKATDWTPAPEDTLQLISHVETEWRQTAQGFEQDITKVETGLNGKASLTAFNTLKSTVDGTVQRIGNAEGRLTTVETNVNGLQTTVSNKAEQSTVTQLSNSFNVLVTDFNNLEVGGRNYVTKQKIEDMKNVGTGGSINTNHPDCPNGFHSLNNQAQTGIFRMNNVINSNGYWTVSFDIRGSQSAIVLQSVSMSDSAEVIVRTNATNTWERATVTFYISNYEEDKAYLDFRPSWAHLFIKDLKVEKGNKATDWTSAPEDMASQAQLSVLTDQINLRVSKGELISQINIEAGRTLIQSDLLVLDANTVLFTGSAFIPGAYIVDATINSAKIANAAITTAKIGNAQINNAKIANLAVNEAKIANLAVSTAKIANAAITNAKIANLAVDTAQIANAAISSAKIGTAAIQTAHIGDGVITNAKIGNAEITGAKIQDASIASAKIINLDVNRIVGNTSEFIRSGWNSAAGGSVSISGNGISSHAPDNSQVYIQNGIMGVRNPSGATLGHIGYHWETDRAFYHIQTSLGTNFAISARVGNAANNVRRTMLDIFPGSSETYVRTNDFRHVGATGDSTLPTARFSGRVLVDDELRLSGGNIVNPYGIYFANGGEIYSTSDSSLWRFDAVNNGIMQFRIGTTQKFRIDATRNYMNQILNMQGNQIVETSDARLKTNIKPATDETLRKLKLIEYVDYQRIDNGLYERGFIAQQVRMVAPEIIQEEPDGMLTYGLQPYIHFIGRATQQLANEHENTLKVASHAYLLAEQHEYELAEAKRKIKELEEKVERLEGAA